MKQTKPVAAFTNVGRLPRKRWAVGKVHGGDAPAWDQSNRIILNRDGTPLVRGETKGDPFPPAFVTPVVEPPPPPPPKPLPKRRTKEDRYEEAARITEQRVAAMNAGHVKLKERQHATPDMLERMAKMPVAELATRVNNRWYMVALYHLSGMSNLQVAKALGYKSTMTVKQALARPEIALLVRRVRELELEKVMAGEYGVKAQAKAGAGAVMTKVLEKAGAHGESKVAKKDSDMLTAAKTVLTVAGELNEKGTTVNVNHVFAQFTKVEMDIYVDTGRWPVRFRELGEQMGVPIAEEDA